MADWTTQESLALHDLPDDLTRNNSTAYTRLTNPPTRFGGYFQSPFSKRKLTRDPDGTGTPSFAFDGDGALLDQQQVDRTYQALQRTLGTVGPSCKPGSYLRQVNHQLKGWLERGVPLEPQALGALRCALEGLTLTNDRLHSQPICRLVQKNQLRYDPHYQAIYQLTPAQMRLLEAEDGHSTARGPQTTEPDLHTVQRHQPVFWGLSDDLQSALAMFDSDLGRDWYTEAEEERFIQDLRPSGLPPSLRATKRLLELRLKDVRSSITPHELNIFSPLRYWAPPPAFARSVFHMLFWQAILTGEDLYHRPLPGHRKMPSPEILHQRIGSYFVAINRFQAGSYRIANYAGIFHLLATVTRYVERERKDLSKVRIDEKDAVSHLFFADHGRLDPALRPPSKPLIHFTLPFRNSNECTVLEPALSYYRRPGKAQSTNSYGPLLLYLRDRMIELFLWAHFQMEIRSVGAIPMHRLYRIRVGSNLFRMALGMAEKWFKEEGTPADLEEEFSESLFSDVLSKEVVLEKVFDRSSHRVIGKTDVAWLMRHSSELN